jgi:hypothetical protein
MSMIVNVVCSSCKHNDELQAAFQNEIIHLVENGDIETGRGANCNALFYYLFILLRLDVFL